MNCILDKFTLVHLIKKFRQAIVAMGYVFVHPLFVVVSFWPGGHIFHSGKIFVEFCYLVHKSGFANRRWSNDHDEIFIVKHFSYTLRRPVIVFVSFGAVKSLLCGRRNHASSINCVTRFCRSWSELLEVAVIERCPFCDSF